MEFQTRTTLIKCAEETLPFYMDHLQDIFLKKAEAELNENPKNKVKGLQGMREIIKSDNTLDDLDFHDDMLMKFLRHSKYNIPKAYLRFKNYIVFRKKQTCLFKYIPFEESSRTRSGRYLTVLPRRTTDGCTVLVAEYGYWRPAEITLEEFERIGLMIFQQSLRDPMAQINGYKVIHDFKDTSLRYMTHVTPQRLFRLYQTYLTCLPLRFKESHVVNHSAAFKIVWGVLKNVISKKLRERVFIHSYPEELLNYFPRSMLPVQYGGDLKDYYQADWIRNSIEQHKTVGIGGQPNYY